ncbi:Auxin efflux carrier [Pleurotus pulmonarius]|nr:hypothetical protein EYR38_002307 [Pleurotus pulmonarius]
MDVEVISPLETPVWSLLKTVFASILEVFLLCIAGYILASHGILDKKTQKQLNRLNVSLFTPCLLFSKVAFFLSPAKLKELWIIPIFFTVVTLVSMSIAFVLGWMFRLKRSQRSFAMAAAMFMNSNSLPIALMQSLVVTVPGLKWGPGDNKNAMVGRALTYLVLYSTLGMVVRWSYGVRLLAHADEVSQASEVNERSPLLETFNEAAARDASAGIESNDVLVDTPPLSTNGTLRPPKPHRRTTFYKSFPNSPNESQADLPTLESTPGSAPDSDSDDSYDEENPSPTRRAHTTHSSNLGMVFLRRARRRVARSWAEFNEFMTVPLWAALASLIVACIQPLQHLLEMHMQPVKFALTSAGNCSIPLTLIVLGAYFYPNQEQTTPASANGVRATDSSATLTATPSSSSLFNNVRDLFKKGRHADGGSTPRGYLANLQRAGETKTVVIAVAARMILTPLCLLPLMAIGARYDSPKVFDDPVFVVANVLLISSPPALTLAQITQAASGDAFERLISRTIFWSYCVVTPPATIAYVVIGLILAKL